MTGEPGFAIAHGMPVYDYTEAEFRDLFSAAGLRLIRVIPTASPNSILEGVLA